MQNNIATTGWDNKKLIRRWDRWTLPLESRTSSLSSSCLRNDVLAYGTRLN